MTCDEGGLGRLLERIHEKREEMLARIDESGLLELTMADIRPGVSFENAQCYDIKYSFVPVYSARKITLSHEGRTRILKEDRMPPMECGTCGGDQYLQPCPDCGEE